MHAHANSCTQYTNLAKNINAEKATFSSFDC